MKTLLTLIVMAGLVGSTDKFPKPTLKSVDADVQLVKKVLIKVVETQGDHEQQIVDKINELEDRIEALERKQGKLPIY